MFIKADITIMEVFSARMTETLIKFDAWREYNIWNISYQVRGYQYIPIEWIISMEY